MSHYLETAIGYRYNITLSYCAFNSPFLTAITEQLQFEQNKSFTSFVEHAVGHKNPIHIIDLVTFPLVQL